MSRYIYLIIILGFLSCKQKENNKIESSSIRFEIKNLKDKEYPDNPDIGYRSLNYKSNYFTSGELECSSAPFNFTFSFYTVDSDSIYLENIDLSEYIPTIPNHIKSDEYLSYISIINQEWNRNQIKFLENQFQSTDKEITRVDLARNCLNAYLWEVIIYIEENNKEVPCAHGWFDFPHEKYAQLFEQKNNVPFSKFKAGLENWIDPESKVINLESLRTVSDSIFCEYEDLSDKMYPLKAARLKKRKEVIFPDSFAVMKDLQTDSSLFATFTPPGFYNKKDPRKTELGRFYNLQNAQLREITSKANKEKLHEIELTFSHKCDSSETSLIIGGLDLKAFPVLSDLEANKGWKSSMGIGNHTFYEKYKDHLATKTANSPYYAVLLDEKGKWLDSHQIGIDGPIFYFSDEQRTELNLWLLSFERHSLIGHYKLKFQ